MYNRNLEKLTPLCMKVIKNISDTNSKDMKKDGGIKKEFNGYFASFGPSVIMAGLHQTVLFYADTNKKDKQGYVNEIIWEVIREAKWDEDMSSLQDYTSQNSLVRKNHILDVVSACKLAIRTFDLKG